MFSTRSSGNTVNHIYKTDNNEKNNLITRRKVISTLITAALINSTLIPAISQACTSIIVGEDASANGTFMLSRTEDFSINSWAKHMVVRKEEKNSKGSRWIMANGLEVPAPEKTYRYTAMPDWDAHTTASTSGRSFEERGVNENNVAISATNSAKMNKKAEKADPLATTGITEQIIPSLILPQAESAKQAVKLLGNYVKKYGAGEANGIQIADSKEIWYMEIGSGHHWIAVKVPDDSYIAVANALRIHDVNLNDKKNILHSDGLEEFIKKNELLDDFDAKSFNFAKAFGELGDEYSVDRIWLVQKLLSPSVKQKPRQKQYPLLMKPDQDISVQDIAKVLRANYKGTELEGKAERKIGVDRTSEAHIIEINRKMPKPLQAVIWQTPANSLYSPFIPLFNVMENIPTAYQYGTDQYDTNSAWWAFRSVGSLAQTGVHNGKYTPVVTQYLSKKENQMISSHYDFAEFLKKIYKSSPDEAVQFAGSYSNGLLNTQLNDIRRLFSGLMTDLTRSTEKKYTKEEFEKIKSL